MHQDYTAIALLLFTALPLLCVAATAFFYVTNSEQKHPLREKILSINLWHKDSWVSGDWSLE